MPLYICTFCPTQSSQELEEELKHVEAVNNLHRGCSYDVNTGRSVRNPTIFCMQRIKRKDTHKLNHLRARTDPTNV